MRGRPRKYFKDETKPTLIQIDAEVHKILQEYSVETGMTMLSIVSKAVQKYIQKNL
jgi:hypothetical protein